MLRTSVDMVVAAGASAALGGVASIISTHDGNKGKQTGAAQISRYACNWYDLYSSADPTYPTHMF